MFILREPLSKMWFFVGLLFFPPGWWLWSSNFATQHSSTQNRLDTLHLSCVQAMIANTCKIMDVNSSVKTAKPGELVFIAGVGAVSALDYQHLYAAGDAMCIVVKEACAREWDGTQCQTARKVFATSTTSGLWAK